MTHKLYKRCKRGGMRRFTRYLTRFMRNSDECEDALDVVKDTREHIIGNYHRLHKNLHVVVANVPQMNGLKRYVFIIDRFIDMIENIHDEAVYYKTLSFLYRDRNQINELDETYVEQVKSPTAPLSLRDNVAREPSYDKKMELIKYYEDKKINMDKRVLNNLVGNSYSIKNIKKILDGVDEITCEEITSLYKIIKTFPPTDVFSKTMESYQYLTRLKVREDLEKSQASQKLKSEELPDQSEIDSLTRTLKDFTISDSSHSRPETLKEVTNKENNTIRGDIGGTKRKKYKNKK